MFSVTLTSTLSQTLRWPKVKSILRKVKSVFLKVTLIHWFLSIPKIWRHIIASTVLTIIAIAMSVVSAKFFVIGNVDFTTPDSGFNSSVGRAPTIVLRTDFIAIDATERTLTLDWYVDCPSVLGDTVNFYFDRDTQVPSVDLPSTPIFSVNCTALPNLDIPTSTPTFRTVNKLTSDFYKNATNPGQRSSLQFYPFDKYVSLFFMFAKTNSNSSVGISMGESITAPANFEVKVNKEFSGGDNQSSQYVLNISRSKAVKALVIIIILANWFVTIAFMWITVASVIWPERVVKDLFVIPIASLFAFTAVRSNMPGAPSGFGSVVDYGGILPNLVIMTLCSAILLSVVLIRRTRGFTNDLEATGKRADAGVVDALGTAEKMVATANEAPTVVNGALAAANPPPTAEIQKHDSVNEAPTVADGALAAAPPAAEIQRRVSTNDTPTVADGALAAAPNPPPLPEIQRRDSTNEGLTVVDGAFVAETPPPAAEIQRRDSMGDAPTVANGVLVAANPPPATKIHRRTNTIEAPSAVNPASATSMATSA